MHSRGGVATLLDHVPTGCVSTQATWQKEWALATLSQGTVVRRAANSPRPQCVALALALALEHDHGWRHLWLCRPRRPRHVALPSTVASRVVARERHVGAGRAHAQTLATLFCTSQFHMTFSQGSKVGPHQRPIVPRLTRPNRTHLTQVTRPCHCRWAACPAGAELLVSPVRRGN